MTIDQLRQRLDAQGVHPGAYDLEGTQKDEVYCLERQQDRWRYYYRERGIHRDERRFDSEDAACDFFLHQVLRDPTTRRPR